MYIYSLNVCFFQMIMFTFIDKKRTNNQLFCFLDIKKIIQIKTNMYRSICYLLFLQYFNFCTAKNYTQQLLFGSTTKDGITKHWCDIKLKPNDEVIQVTVFLKAFNKKSNVATSQASLPTTKSPITQNAFRVYIPPTLRKDPGFEYTFQYEFKNDRDMNIYSEPFAFDKKLGEFRLVSGFKEEWYENKYLVYGVIGSIIIICLFLIYIVKSKSNAKKLATV